MFVQKTCNYSITPRRSTDGAAGYDLFSIEDTLIYSGGGQAVISVGVRIQVPDGTYGRIAPRSGLAAKHSIDVMAGVIDRDYQGDVKVILINHGQTDFLVSKGDRIAQLIVEKIEMPEIVHVCDFDEKTLRGEGGFGSTGI